MKLLKTLQSSFVIVLFIVLSNQAYGQYILCSDVISNGGVVSDNSTFYLAGTVGQTAIGVTSNSTFDLSSGFWYSVYCVTGILEVDSHIPLEFKLFNNYPNPFNPTTTIKYSVKERSFVALILYDILGREVGILVNQEQIAGSYEVKFNAKGFSSGIYFYRISAGKFTDTKKLIILK